MELFQQILVYVVLALAIGYLLMKFVLPKSLFSTSDKKSSNGCDHDDCGCH